MGLHVLLSSYSFMRTHIKIPEFHHPLSFYDLYTLFLLPIIILLSLVFLYHPNFLLVGCFTLNTSQQRLCFLQRVFPKQPLPHGYMPTMPVEGITDTCGSSSSLALYFQDSYAVITVMWSQQIQPRTMLLELLFAVSSSRTQHKQMWKYRKSWADEQSQCRVGCLVSEPLLEENFLVD